MCFLFSCFEFEVEVGDRRALDHAADIAWEAWQHAKCHAAELRERATLAQDYDDACAEMAEEGGPAVYRGQHVTTAEEDFGGRNMTD